MQLSIYIDEKLIETMRIPAGNIPINELMSELRKKYASLLKESSTHRFVLEEVPSRINEFRSLMG